MDISGRRSRDLCLRTPHCSVKRLVIDLVVVLGCLALGPYDSDHAILPDSHRRAEVLVGVRSQLHVGGPYVALQRLVVQLLIWWALTGRICPSPHKPDSSVTSDRGRR